MDLSRRDILKAISASTAMSLLPTPVMAPERMSS